MRESLSKLIKKLTDYSDSAFLISSPENIRYFSGFTGSSGVLFIHKYGRYLITDFRYMEQGKNQCPDYSIIDAPGQKGLEFIHKICMEYNIKSIVFEEEYITYKDYISTKTMLKDMDLIPSKGSISKERVIKTGYEINCIKKASALADYGYEYILNYMKSGISEKEIALELEFFLRKNGSEGLAFDIIIASGKNAALPHAQPSDKVLETGDVVILDFGCVIDGYCSDMTRTIFIEEINQKIEEIYYITLEAQKIALKALGPGITGIDADRLAREYIESKGFGEFFGHGLGHGIGLKIHEAPRLSKLDSTTLAKGMVVTVEPGIYLPGVGGVRIEDLVVITDNGIENITGSTKDLLVI